MLPLLRRLSQLAQSSLGILLILLLKGYAFWAVINILHAFMEENDNCKTESQFIYDWNDKLQCNEMKIIIKLKHSEGKY